MWCFFEMKMILGELHYKDVRPTLCVPCFEWCMVITLEILIFQISLYAVQGLAESFRHLFPIRLFYTQAKQFAFSKYMSCLSWHDKINFFPQLNICFFFCLANINLTKVCLSGLIQFASQCPWCYEGQAPTYLPPYHQTSLLYQPIK